MIAVIGFFDGIHKAHQSLFNHALNWAKNAGKKPVVITFDLHPKSVIYGLEIKYITPLSQKVKRLKVAGFETVFVIEFTPEKALIKAQDFIQNYLTGLYGLVCGFDFRFGHEGHGDVTLLKSQAPFLVEVLAEVRHSDQKIGSSIIRELIETGKVEQVEELLDRFYSIEGEVLHGEKKGRLIGYPTANLNTDAFLIPKKGVYASWTKVAGKVYASMTNVGKNPTLNAHHPLSVESYLFDFNQTIYGEMIETFFVKRLRDEEKFESVVDLIAQIDADAVATKTILATKKKPLSST
jgi:riboflavin kinase/FMN adenylyltransferase